MDDAQMAGQINGMDGLVDRWKEEMGGCIDAWDGWNDECDGQMDGKKRWMNA